MAIIRKLFMGESVKHFGPFLRVYLACLLAVSTAMLVVKADPPVGNGSPGVSITSPTNTLAIGGTSFNPTVDLSLSTANHWTALQQFDSLNVTGIGANVPCVATDASANFIAGTCSGGGGGDTITSPGASLTVGGTSTATTLDLAATQAAAYTWNGAQTWTNFANFTYVPTTACQTGGPTSTICVGSPTVQNAISIGKISGGWGGTTLSDSGRTCWTRNNGTADSQACNYFTSGGTFVLGSGAPTISLNANTTLNANDLTVHDLLQHAANDTGGKCTMAASTSCTVTISKTYSTPVCIATAQGTAIYTAVCSVSGTTVTVSASSSNSATFGVIVFGDPT